MERELSVDGLGLERVRAATSRQLAKINGSSKQRDAGILMTGDGPPTNNPERMVGRRNERKQLHRLLERAGNGSGSLALVSGSAGIGKTTLVNALMETARQHGVLALAGGCYAMTQTPPYALWSEIFHGYDPAPGMPRPPTWLADCEAGDLADGQRTLHEELRRFLVELASAQPVVIVLEDLQWADPASIDALRYVARQHHIPPIFILATMRNDEIAPHQPLYHLLPLLVRESAAVRIELQTLSHAEIQTLVNRRYGLTAEDSTRLVDYLASRTAGNPFFLVEVLRLLEAEQMLRFTEDGWRLDDLGGISVPPLVRQVIEGWLSRLGQEDREHLELAAVIGQEVRPEILESVANVDAGRIAGTLDRALEAGLLTQDFDDGRVNFHHALIRETLYQRLPLTRRRELHRDVGEALAGRPDQPPEIVASHFAQANDARAIDWLVRSGQRALAFYAASDATRAFSRARELAGQFTEQLPPDVYRKSASAHMMQGEFGPARRDFEYVLEQARESGERMLEWQTLIDLALLWAARDYDRSGSYCRAALDLAREIGDRQVIAQSLNRIANWYVNVDDPGRALPLHRQALEIFEEEQDQRRVAETLDFLGMASYLNCDYPGSTGQYERAAALFREVGDRQHLSTCLAMLTLNGGDLDIMATPVYRERAFWFESGEEALDVAREIGWPDGEAFALVTLSMALAAYGELERSVEFAQEALEIAGRIDHREWTVLARYSLGRSWMELHQIERAECELELALAGARRAGWRLGENLSSATLASLFASLEDVERGFAALGTVSKPAPTNSSMAAVQYRHAEARLRLAAGDVESAVEIVDKLIGPEAERDGCEPGTSPLLLKLSGDVLSRAGRTEEASDAYRAAAERAGLYGFLPLLWRTEAARATFYRSIGQAQEAHEANQAARATIQKLANMIDDQALREHFEAGSVGMFEGEQGAAVETLPTDHETLTPREFEVLGHLVEGKTDREIADDLFISPRTVMRHVANILNKLDVSSRTAAATFAVRHDLV